MIDQAILDRTEVRIAALQQERADLVELFVEAEVSTALRQQLAAKDAELVAATAEIARLTALLPGAAKLLFKSDFSTATLGPVKDVSGVVAYQDITGPGWPIRIGGSAPSRNQLNTNPVNIDPATIGTLMVNRIENGALYQEITKSRNASGLIEKDSWQLGHTINPLAEQADLYLKWTHRFQADLAQKMQGLPITNPWTSGVMAGGGTWRALFAFKTGTPGPGNNDGDYRCEVYVRTDGNVAPFWMLLGDNDARPNTAASPFVTLPPGAGFTVTNKAAPVPAGVPFKFGVGWHRSSGADGRIVVDVDGVRIFDRRGPNKGGANMPINRIIGPLLYGGGFLPIYQWVDDLEIWDGIPA